MKYTASAKACRIGVIHWVTCTFSRRSGRDEPDRRSGSRYAPQRDGHFCLSERFDQQGHSGDVLCMVQPLQLCNPGMVDGEGKEMGVL